MIKHAIGRDRDETAPVNTVNHRLNIIVIITREYTDNALMMILQYRTRVLSHAHRRVQYRVHVYVCERIRRRKTTINNRIGRAHAEFVVRVHVPESASRLPFAERTLLLYSTGREEITRRSR